MPMPISVQNIVQAKKSGDWTRAKLGAFGLSMAPKDLDLTPLQRHKDAMVKHHPETPDERAAYHDKMQAIRDGSLKGPEAERVMKEDRKPYDIRLFDKLSYMEARKAFHDYANPEEQKELRGALARKRDRAMRRSPATTRAEEKSVQ